MVIYLSDKFWESRDCTSARPPAQVCCLKSFISQSTGASLSTLVVVVLASNFKTAFAIGNAIGICRRILLRPVTEHYK